MKTEMRNQEGSNLPDPKIGRKQFWIKTARHKPELAKQKSYSKKNMADKIRFSEEETNRSKGRLTIRTEKDKAAGSNANRKLRNIYKSYSKQKSVIRRYFTLILMFKEGVPDRAPSFCFKIYPEKAVL